MLRPLKLYMQLCAYDCILQYFGTIFGTILVIPSVATILQKMRNNPKNIAFRDLIKVSKAYFGEPRIHGSHHFFKTSWIGDPLVNLQEGRNGSAKPYQVRQVLAAIEKLEAE